MRIVRRHPSADPSLFGRGHRGPDNGGRARAQGGSAVMFGGLHASAICHAPRVDEQPCGDGAAFADARRADAVAVRASRARRCLNEHDARARRHSPSVPAGAPGVAFGGDSVPVQVRLLSGVAPHGEAYPQLPPLGEAMRPEDEPLRVCEPAELTSHLLPARHLNVSPGRPPRLLQRIFGLLGPNGPCRSTSRSHAGTCAHHDDVTCSASWTC